MEMFFKEPLDIEEYLIERGLYNVSFSETVLNRHNIDIVKYMKIRFAGLPWKAMVIHHTQGASLYGPESKDSEDPIAGYPIWNKVYSGLSDLLGMVAFPEQQTWQEGNRYIPDRFRPRPGQEPVVVINTPPDIVSITGQSEFFQMKEMLNMRAEGVKVYIHGTRSFRLLFGVGVFDMGSIDIRGMASRGSIVIPTGRVNEVEKLNLNELRWVHMLGYSKQDLYDWRERVKYSIDAALWARDNYQSTQAFKSRVMRGNEVPDVDTPGATYENAPKLDRKYTYSKHVKMGVGDGIACDFCSIARDCKFFREGSVCVMPSRDMSKLAKMFKSRDSSQIISGLGNLLEVQTNRVEKGLENEDASGELDPQVSRELNSIFQNAEKLAKLVDPALRGQGTTVNVGVGIQNQLPGAASIEASSPQQFISGVVKELESRGMSRDEITPDLLEGLLAGMKDKERAEEEIHDAEVIEG